VSKIITFSGKGGVGKTTTAALLIDELALFDYPGRLLVIDGDPATTLYLALGLQPPAATLADVRDELHLDAKTVRGLPGGQTPAQFVAGQLIERQTLTRHRLRRMTFDALAMGWQEGRPGCYCSLNNALSQVLGHLWEQYDLIIADNEAGLEHLSRYRLRQVDLFVTVVTDHLPSRIVAGRIEQVARSVGMQLEAACTVHIGQNNGRQDVVTLPRSEEVAALLGAGQPVVAISASDPCRRALQPLTLQALALGGSGLPDVSQLLTGC
jgi:CO dehydrogenase maturation factor